ncbi:hypothetical protein FAIPA1_20460 [Frankia sp. AiPs1]
MKPPPFDSNPIKVANSGQITIQVLRWLTSAQYSHNILQ